MSNLRRAVRELRYRAPAYLVPALAGIATLVVTEFVGSRTLQAVATPAIAALAGLGRWLLDRPRRRRCLPRIAAAARVVLDGRLWAPGDGSAELSTGEPRTLRALATATRRGQLRSEILAGTRLLETSRQLGAFRDQFDLETRCVGDVAELHPAVVDVAAGLGDLESLLAELDGVYMRLTWGAREQPENASKVEQERTLFEQLAAQLITTVDEAARLEERADPDGARSQADDRARERARIAEDRRCAHRAIAAAARRLYEAADAEVRMQASTWESRHHDLDLARERWVGVTNVHREFADNGTLSLGEKVQELLFDAIQGTSEADAASKKGDDAGVQGGMVKFTTAVTDMGAAVKRLAEHVPVLP